MHIQKYRLFKFSWLICLIFILSACQQKEEVVQYQTIPEVTNKYSDQEIAAFNHLFGQGQENRYESIVARSQALLVTPSNMPTSLFYDSGIKIAYPEDGVKGIYVTPTNISDSDTFNTLLQLIDQTDLNTMVIDFKDDYGNIVSSVNSDNPLVNQNAANFVDLSQTIKTLEAHQIYPIARIVTFKDSVLALDHPELSFKSTETQELWSPEGDGVTFFTNPYLKEVWDYNIAVAKEAAKMGFKEIQFDYIRFPESISSQEMYLQFDKGHYANYVNNASQDIGSDRPAAVVDFLKYAKDQLAPYGVKLSVDTFGTAVISRADALAIGQDIPNMAQHIDVLSAMIYPSHWSAGNFGLDIPDSRPYELVDEYMYSEEIIFKDIPSSTSTRPWLQDFTMYSYYGPDQVQAQINALAKHGVYEFLLWNANGIYTQGVDYAPEKANQSSDTTEETSNNP